MLTARSISKLIGVRTLFRGVSLTVNAGDRLGLIGPNGAGKSTLLRLLAGTDRPDEGEVIGLSKLVLASVAQADTFPEGADARGVVIDAALRGAQARNVHIEPHDAELIAEAGLTRAGFAPAMFTARADDLSGGWRKRLAITASLASAGDAVDLVLLDEPTNHLDLSSIGWLEELVVKLTARRAAAVVYVTHDREFLERVSTRVAELNPAYPGGLFVVDGNYTEFLRRKAEFLEAQAQQQRALAGQVRKDLAWLARGPQGRGTKAKGRIEDSHDRIATLADLRERSAAAERGGSRVDFNASGRRTRKLIAAEGISKSLGGKPLFSGLTITVGAGDRIGLLGNNGSGKTTLIRVLTGDLAPDEGRVTPSHPAPRVAVFSQRRQDIDPRTPLRDALCPGGHAITFRGQSMHITSWSRRFLFEDDQLPQPVASLSGGELARVHIARIMLEPCDVLVLDEPTNDLDIPTLEVMEESLEDFPGGLVLVTHDRAMLGRLATEIVWLDGAGSAHGFASLDQAVAASARLAAPARREPGPARPAEASATTAPAAPAKPRRGKLSFNEQQEYDRIERDIEAAEAQAAETEASLSTPAVAGSHEKLAAACAELERRQARVAALYARWDALERKRSGDAGA